MKFFLFLQHMLRFQQITETKTLPDVASTRRNKLQLTLAKFLPEFSIRFLGRCMHCLSKRRRQKIRNFLARGVTLFAPPALSLAEAATILGRIRQQPQTSENIALQRIAFARLHNYLQQQPASLQAGPLQPLLMLLASCLARLPDIQQRTQAMTLIEVTLLHSPQLALTETLTMQLWGLSGNLIPRAFDAIDTFLRHGCTDPRTQIDILLELIDVMQIPSCRQRAKSLVNDGLKRLEPSPFLQKRIESRLALSDVGAASNHWYRFDS